VASAGEADDLRETWEAVAPAWEQHRDRMFVHTRPVSDWLVDRLDPQPGETVLELTAGPGETGFLVAELVGPSGTLISTDLAPGMVDAARRGAAARGLGNVRCEVVDAQQIGLPDASVDGVLSRFGLMLVPDPVRAFAEIRRVLRPDSGRLAYGVWGAAERNVWIGALVLALIQHGHAPPGDPRTVGGVLSLAGADRNRELLADAGFRDVEVAEVAGAMLFADLDDYWSLQTAVAGPVADLVAAMSPAEIDAVKETLAPAIEPFRSADGYALPSLATVVHAT
jgi:ubiquinone/menaquinone biosynthesis C-methylase UbiE